MESEGKIKGWLDINIQFKVLSCSQPSRVPPAFALDSTELDRFFPQPHLFPLLPLVPPLVLPLKQCPSAFSGVKSFAGSPPWPCPERSWTFWSVAVSESLRRRGNGRVRSLLQRQELRGPGGNSGRLLFSVFVQNFRAEDWPLEANHLRCICLKLPTTMAMPHPHAIPTWGNSLPFLNIWPLKSILLFFCLDVTCLKVLGELGGGSRAGVGVVRQWPNSFVLLSTPCPI